MSIEVRVSTSDSLYWTGINVQSEHILCTEHIVLFCNRVFVFGLSVSPAYTVFKLSIKHALSLSILTRLCL